MSYQALYRKYRPSTLEDVIGQDIVIKILINSIKNNKVGHAYMFSGPRGIGKTSIAKILAKTVNCLDPINGVSCEKCKNCISINQNQSVDIIEIDAASNNGVDEIREIKSKINLVPNELKYKVYIIDEVHMLSIGAFNALLKTLEEPPEHIIFILATTDLHKVPTTIISRCQCYEFNRISTENIVKRLQFICDKENIKCDSTVLTRIGELSDGGLRDSIGMLDKLNAYSNSNITLDDFEKVNGIVTKDELSKFIDYIYNNDIKNVIEFIDNSYNCGKNLIILVQDLIQMCKNEYISYYIDNKQNDSKFYLDLADDLNLLLRDSKSISNIKTVFEITVLSFMGKSHNFIENSINFEQKSVISTENSDSKPIISVIEDKKEENLSSKIVEKAKIEENLVEFVDNTNDIINNCFARANKTEKTKFMSLWNKLEDYALDNNYGSAACYLSDGEVCAVGEGEVIISFEYDSMVDRGKGLIRLIEQLFDKIYSKHYDIALITKERWNLEKSKFIKNKNDGIEYVYKKIENVSIDAKTIDKHVKINSDNSITNQAIELFGENTIQIS